MARATLRRVLADCLAVDPRSLRFDYGVHGKPALAGDAAGQALRFNASHSGERLLVGLAPGADIGVDLERHRPTVDRDGLVRRYFSARENEVYFALPEDRRDLAFFECWTRKEAVVKALGRGLTFPLKDFDVGFVPGAPGLARLQHLQGEDIGWCLCGLDVEPGYSAAVVVPGRACRISTDFAPHRGP